MTAGDFSKHPDKFMREEGPIGYTTITNMGKWDFMATTPPEDKGYMFWGNSTCNEIMNKIDRSSKNGHSGSSLGFLMQHMHYIAKNGWEVYYKKFIELS